jgi:aldehyde dehydrogenase (NAD+)
MNDVLNDLGLRAVNSGACGAGWTARPGGGELSSINPTTEEILATVLEAGVEDYDVVAQAAQARFPTWCMMPAPKRGEIVRQLGLELRTHQQALGRLISLEAGKIAPSVSRGNSTG